MPKFSPTAHQIAIFDHLKTTRQNLIVQACAGAGKTTTIVEAMKIIKGETLYLVFNTRNKDEAVRRLAGTDAEARTFNSLGAQVLRGSIGRADLKTNKVWKAWDVVSARLRMDADHAKGVYGAVKRLVDIARQVGVGYLVPDVEDTWYDLCDHHEIGLDDPVDNERLVGWARAVLTECNAMARARGIIDFTDQLYLSLHPDFGGKWPRPRNIFVDEVQDLSPVQVAMVARMARGMDPASDKMAARCVFVGDRGQAIYGWRGADSGAMATIRAMFGCAELPLSVSFRCPQEVVRVAASFGAAPIEPADNAPMGNVVRVPSGTPYEIDPGSTVLCRTTAPLVRVAFALLAAGRPATVLGKDLGRHLASMVESAMNAPAKKAQRAGDAKGALDATMANLTEWSIREIAKADGKEDKIAAIEDRLACINVLREALQPDDYSIAGLIAAIERLFSDDPDVARGRVVCSTIHKAKGLEWPTVVWVNPDARGFGRQEWQLVQENNCRYVAATRAQETLVLVDVASINAGLAA